MHNYLQKISSNSSPYSIRMRDANQRFALIATHLPTMTSHLVNLYIKRNYSIENPFENSHICF